MILRKLQGLKKNYFLPNFLGESLEPNFNERCWIFSLCDENMVNLWITMYCILANLGKFFKVNLSHKNDIFLDFRPSNE